MESEELTPLRYKITGPSRKGYHSYSSYGACSMRAHLDSLSEKNHSPGTGEGVILHAYADLYHSKAFDGLSTHNIIFEDAHTIPDIALTAADNTWRQYVEKVPQDSLGEVLATELDLDHPSLIDLFGVDITARLDLVTFISPEIASIHNETYNTDLYSGVYLVDHKFLSRTPTNMELKYLNSMQFLIYMLAYNHLNKTKVNGLIANVVIKTKELKIHRLVVPPPSDYDLVVVKSALAKWNAERAKEPTPNPLEDNCFPLYGVCPHFLTGACSRT